MITFITVAILILSIVVHEVSHGYAADWLGDPTPRLQGRLTLNPIRHMDLVGSVLLPIILVLSNAGFIFGWAKPVEYNPYNIKNKRRGELLIALAGPLSNIAIALVFSLIIRAFNTWGSLSSSTMEIFSYIVLINLTLAVFNLIPVPPLDGSKIFLSMLPQQYGAARMFIEKYAIILIFVVIFFLWQYIYPIVPMLFRLFTGI